VRQVGSASTGTILAGLSSVEVRTPESAWANERRAGWVARANLLARAGRQGPRANCRLPMRPPLVPCHARSSGLFPAVRTILLLAIITTLSGCRSTGRSRDRTQSVRFESVSGYIEFVARDRKRDQKSKTNRAADLSTKETLLEQNLKLETKGYVYHPNFVEFTLGAVFGLLQNDYKQEIGGVPTTSSDDGEVLEFDLEADFFKKKKYPGSIFARRDRAIEPRPFQPSLEVTTTTYGFNWQYVDETTPTSMQFFDSEVNLDPVGGNEGSGYQHNTEFRFETAYNFSDTNRLSLRYSFRSVQEQPFELDYDVNEIKLGHKWHFGAHRQHRLDSELQYFKQVGTFNIDRLRWREILRMEHSDALRSWYVLEVLDRQQGSLAGVEPIDERSYSLTGTLEHEIYESLVTQLTVFGQRQEFGRGLTIERLGFTTNLDYRKKNRWGTLLSNYQFRVRAETRDGGTRQNEVLDERHTFADPAPILLSNTVVNSGSIRITDEERTTEYRAGRDYTLSVVGDRTEIRRVPSGLIADGQTVLIDYVFTIGGDFDLDTVSHRFMIRQNFDFGLSPYYRYLWQDQELDPKKAAGVTPEDIRSHLFGLEYVRGGLRLQAEYEKHDSTISPFDSMRLSASYTHRFKFGGTGSLRGRWTDITYDDPINRDTTFFSVEGRYRQAIKRNLVFEGAVLYREEEDSLSGNDRGVEAEFALEWYVRDTEMRMTYEYGSYDDRFSQNEYSAVWIQVRRNF